MMVYLLMKCNLGILLIIVAAMQSATTRAFSLLPATVPVHRRALVYQVHFPATETILFQSEDDNHNLPTSRKIEDMKELIASLSADSDDISRRGKLATLFTEKLQEQDEGESFIQLFDRVLIIFGDRIRLEASDAVASVIQNVPVNIDGEDADAETKLPSFPLPPQQKSELESRLWACVDMMVQSKTLVKQAKAASGSTGSSS
jgi:hypothetical protein